MAERLAFLHLSDIHFAKRSGGAFDLDQDLRSQLERDVVRVRERVGQIAGVLVAGDVAYSGRGEEYKRAIDWLAQLCRLIHQEEEKVWVVPGNHDVRRDVIASSTLLKDLHERLRRTDPDTLAAEFAQRCQDAECARLLLRPLEEYIAFAARFRCTIGPNQPYWEDRFQLNDGSVLRLRGLNSTLVSDELDDEDSNKLVLGESQAALGSGPGEAYMILCHHPPDWLRDRGAVRQMLNQRASVQLFGHKHSQAISCIQQDGGPPSVQLFAGAVHPDRESKSWSPRYNFLSLEVVGAGDSRALKVTVYPRVWQDEAKEFGPDPSLGAGFCRAYSLDLPAWEPEPETIPQEAVPVAGALSADQDPSKAQNMQSAMSSSEPYSRDAARRLAYRFLTLPYHKIVAIAHQLDLLADQDEGLRDFELFREIFKRANARVLLAELWDAVESEHGNQHLAENPFRPTSG